MGIRTTVAALGLLLVASCAAPGSPQPCPAVSILWVNFIQVGATQYVAGPQMNPVALQEGDLGPVYAHVKFTVSGNVCDATYKIKDGDAAFLDPGTSIYQVNGHTPTQELAARFNGTLTPYVAQSP